MTDPTRQFDEARVTARLKELIRGISGFVDSASTEQKRRLLLCFLEDLQPNHESKLTAWLKDLLQENDIARYLDGATAAEKQRLLTSLEDLEAIDRRGYPRKRCSIAVTVDGISRDLIKNVSAGGVFIETSMAFEPGNYVTLEFSLPNQEEPTKVTGKIVRKSASGIGVRFTVVSQRMKEMIESL